MQASYYYRYTFISPAPLYALIKEELRSYFESSAIDDVLFSRWTERCLQKLGRGTLDIFQTLLPVTEGGIRLPKGFSAVREAWLCTESTQVFTQPTSTYTQVTTTVNLTDPSITCQTCTNPVEVEAVYKTSGQVIARYRRSHLLQPGQLAAAACAPDCLNTGVTHRDVFEVRDGKLWTNFREGTLLLVYYAQLRDGEGFQLIPDEVHILEYIEAYLKFKLFEQLSNQASDETAKQLEYKRQQWNNEQLDRKEAAEIWMKKKTIHQVVDGIKKDRNRNRGYNIS